MSAPAARRLVITADDLGRDPASTEVILGLLADGAVSATTLIPVAPGAEAALAGARDHGTTPHLHVTLTSEGDLAPWRPLTDAASFAVDGALPADPVGFESHASADDVMSEASAQLAWMRAHGAHPAAVDSHAGTLYGLHGSDWLPRVLAWCAAEGLAFRLPRDPGPYFGGDVPGHLAAAHTAAVALADELGVALPTTMLTNSRDADALGDYESLRSDLIARLRDLPVGTSELFLHPSAAGVVPGPAGTARAWEARLLRDRLWHAALARERIEIVKGWWS